MKNPEKLADQIVQAIHQYDLDGVNVDIENVTSTYRDAYTQLVRSLREKLPEEKGSFGCCCGKSQWMDNRLAWIL